MPELSTHPLCEVLPSERTVAGPFILFDGSFEIEFLQPDPQRHASTLFKATYKHGHHWCKKGKGHPQSPPLHIHFTQTESFAILSGQIGTTSTPQNGMIGAVKDQVHDKESTRYHPHDIEPWTPHSFWPVPEATEDSVLLLWATPEGPFPPMMDNAFFTTILRYISDITEKKVKMDIPQIMINQHESESCVIMFPGAWWLGPLRWWIPWKVQAFLSLLAAWQGKHGLMKEYVAPEDWRAYMEGKKLS